ncbi:MAG TPA: GDP-mannose 4,6-dehydratase [Bacillota bacterium]|jgi:UDP-glucose 4-epimerase
MRRLVTGGAGFIGSHLTEALSELGHKVGVVDNLSTGSLDNLAAQVNVRDSLEHPTADAKANVLGSVNVLENSVRTLV